MRWASEPSQSSSSVIWMIRIHILTAMLPILLILIIKMKWETKISNMAVHQHDSFLQTASNGHSRNCSFWHFVFVSFASVLNIQIKVQFLKFRLLLWEFCCWGLESLCLHCDWWWSIPEDEQAHTFLVKIGTLDSKWIYCSIVNGDGPNTLCLSLVESKFCIKIFSIFPGAFYHPAPHPSLSLALSCSYTTSRNFMLSWGKRPYLFIFK